MVNLWGLVPVLGGWGSAMQSMTDAEKREGESLHAGMDQDCGRAGRPPGRSPA
jgi:hypothetical protein